MFDRSYVIAHKGHPHFIANSKMSYLAKYIRSQIDERDFETIKNLSDPTKFRIYLLLSKVEEIPVSDIKVILGLSQSAVSHALSDLRKVDLVESHRCGQLICYSLNTTNNKGVLSFLERFVRRHKV
ncbi:MAG: winged helix-turn-helix transcriptional regulator [Candidatus Levybacteria bacterium]|nr:winged helix-turn-helix transcriptional regulator [Candidatus Levybacteria bacterium]